VKRRVSGLASPVGLGIAVLAVVMTAAPAAERLAVENAWVPLAPPAIRVHAAYMTVANRGVEDQVIVGAESPDYEHVELHVSSIRQGISEMRAVGGIPVPAGRQFAFEPGGTHIMLINPKRAYAVDDRVRLVLRLQGGETVETSAMVRRRGQSQEPAAHHHGHHR
jgi:copper(I)-binding protein